MAVLEKNKSAEHIISSGTSTKRMEETAEKLRKDQVSMAGNRTAEATAIACRQGAQSCSLTELINAFFEVRISERDPCVSLVGVSLACHFYDQCGLFQTR